MAGKNLQLKWWRAAWLPVVAGLVSAAVPPAQTPRAQESGRSKYYYDAPHQLQPKMEISWGETRLLPTGGNVLLKPLKVDTFQVTGERGPTMEAPECVFNASEVSGTSPGPFKVRTGDGKSFIEGTGYLWTYKGSNLTVTISNNVATTLKRDFLATGTNLTAQAVSATNQFVHIHADRVFMDRAAGLITYTGHVQAEDERLALTCDVLTIRSAAGGATVGDTNALAGGKISEIVADQHVVIIDKAAGGPATNRATGDRAVYGVVDGAEVVTLTGTPHWEAGLRNATAQAFIYYFSTNTLRAVGDANFRLPSDSIGKSGFVMLPQPGAGTNTSETASGMMDITAGAITLEMPETNGASLRGVIAETNVLMVDTENESRASAERAVYTQTNGVLQLTGHALWQMSNRVARGELLSFNQNDNSFIARTNAFLQFPPGELKQSAAFGGMLATNAGQPVNRLIKVSADAYDYQNETLTFRDHVRGALLEDEVVRDTLESSNLEVGFIHTNLVRYVIADGGAHLHQLPAQDAQGKTVEGDFTSDRLEIRMRTNELTAQTNVLLEQVIATGGVRAIRTEISTNILKPVVVHLPDGGTGTNFLPQTKRLAFSADRLTASFLPDTNQVNVITSEGNVIMTQDDSTARGGKVVYSATNDTAVLTGDPKLQTMEGWMTSDDMIIYNRAKGTVEATRHTHLVFDLPAGAADKISPSATTRQKSK